MKRKYRKDFLDLCKKCSILEANIKLSGELELLKKKYGENRYKKGEQFGYRKFRKD